MLLNKWVKRNFKTTKFLETKENANTTYPNLWNSATVVLKEKFIA
jgi:hypothetical protein